MIPSTIDPAEATLLSNYALEPAPESVARLSSLISGRGDVMKSIAGVIAGDPALTFRLLEGDVPKHNVLAEVEARVFRYGVEGVIVLAMVEPLLAAVIRTFETMVESTPVEVNAADYSARSADGVMSRLAFTGRAEGQVFIRGSQHLWSTVAAKVLQIGIGEAGAAETGDVVGELSNMIVGNFKSNLNDAGLACKLSVPIVSDEAFTPPKVPKGRHRSFALLCFQRLLLVDIAAQCKLEF